MLWFPSVCWSRRVAPVPGSPGAPRIWQWVKNWYPNWKPGKWSQGLKPAVFWWLNFDPYPFLFPSARLTMVSVATLCSEILCRSFSAASGRRTPDAGRGLPEPRKTQRSFFPFPMKPTHKKGAQKNMHPKWFQHSKSKTAAASLFQNVYIHIYIYYI